MLAVAGLLLLTLGGYFWWVRSQNLLVAQSQSWNAALAVAEAGIEEGLAQINVEFGTNYQPSLQANWGAGSGGLYALGPRTNASGFYTVQLLATNPGPVIISTGAVYGPVLSRPVTRTVQVTTAPAYAFSKVITTRQNLTFNLKDVPTPNTAGWLGGLPPASQGTYILQAPFNYMVNGDVSLNSAHNISVVGNGLVQLYVSGNFVMYGPQQPSITIAPGATLLLYVGTPTGPPVRTVLETVANGGTATNFQYFGLPSNTNLSLNGSSGFTGMVYAPNATLSLTAANRTLPLPVQGAFVAGMVVTNGLFNFYYNPTLSTNGPLAGFTVTSWREL